jgi:hypothetical protein
MIQKFNQTVSNLIEGWLSSSKNLQCSYSDQNQTSKMEEGTPRSGCTDPFSIFAFLAFALAVMDLLMEMQRKR